MINNDPKHRSEPYLIVLFCALLASGCSGDSEQKTKEKINSCIENLEKQCKRACEADPIGMYCIAKNGKNIIGSGCTREMKDLPNSTQIDKCYKAAGCDLSTSWEAHNQCTQKYQ